MAAKPKPVVILGAVAVLIAAVASYALYSYLKGQEKKVSEAVATERVVVAATEIPLGTTINITQVKTTPWPKTDLPQGSFSGTGQVIGRTTTRTILSSDAVTEAKLMPKEGPVGIMTYKIPEGHRAMTVGVDQVAGVAGFINPGDIVDVVLTVTPPGSNQSLSKIVLQNVPVLAIGQIVEQKEGKPVNVPTVTVDVTPEDAERLAIASTQGRLQLVLRRLGDKEVARTTGETVTRVISGATSGPLMIAREERRSASVRTRRRAVKKEEPKKPVEEAVKPAEEATVSVEVLRRGQKTTQQFKEKSGPVTE
jgi:pilus assembly protein CpaB